MQTPTSQSPSGGPQPGSPTGSPPTGSPISGLAERRALRLVRLEGFLGEVFTSLTGSAFLTGLALWLGAGPLALGLLVALPFMAQVAQLLAPILERRLQSRRRFVVPAFVLGRLLWLVPAGLAAAGWRGNDALLLAMAALFAMALIGMVGVNGWTSWMADLVPAGQRARLFGTRLRMNFLLIGLHASVVLATRMLMTRWWSRAIDRVGSVRVLIGSSFGAAIVPLLWMWPTADRLWPIWVEAVISGVFWTGFNQAAFLQPLAVLAPAERSHGLALSDICTGAALFVASLLGGVVLHGFGTEIVAGQTLLDATGFYVLFALSTLIRLFVAMLALRLTEPDVALHRFLFDFMGRGILRPGTPDAPHPKHLQDEPGPSRRRPSRR